MRRDYDTRDVKNLRPPIVVTADISQGSAVDLGASVSKRPVLLFLEIEIPSQRLEQIKHLGLPSARHAHPELSDESRAVSGLPQQDGITSIDEFVRNRRRPEGESVCTLPQSRQQARPACGTDRRGDEGVFEPDAISGQSIDDGRLQERMSRTAQKVVPLVVREKEDNVGP